MSELCCHQLWVEVDPNRLQEVFIGKAGSHVPGVHLAWLPVAGGAGDIERWDLNSKPLRMTRVGSSYQCFLVLRVLTLPHERGIHSMFCPHMSYPFFSAGSFGMRPLPCSRRFADGRHSNGLGCCREEDTIAGTGNHGRKLRTAGHLRAILTRASVTRRVC